MNGRTEMLVELLVALLLAVGALLLYLEWWRGGELEILQHRIDELEQKRQGRANGSGSSRKPAARKPAAEPEATP